MLYSSLTVAGIAVQNAAAQTDGGGGQGAPSLFGPEFILMIVAMFGIMYFISWRPQQKQEQQRRAMLDAMEKGDRVVTAGGIFGTIVGADSTKVVLRISEEPVMKIEVMRSSVARVLKDEDETDES